MLNILVTGSKGQLGSEIESLSIDCPYNFIFTDKDELDISNQKVINSFVKKHDIDVIINCAAYTSVDRAEEEQALADKINHQAVNYLAQVSKENNIKLIHISTDYVFNGRNFKPYTEIDNTNPQGVYGQTKLDGEKDLQAINPKNSIIIRTSWLYSSFGNNFVKTMFKLGKEKETLDVIFDQVGTPTYANDLAKAILDIVPNLNNGKVEVYHYSNEGVVSWYDFAKEIMRLAKIECDIKPIKTKDYPTPALRPHCSLLNKSKIKKEFNINIPFWKDSLDKCLRILEERKSYVR